MWNIISIFIFNLLTWIERRELQNEGVYCQILMFFSTAFKSVRPPSIHFTSVSLRPDSRADSPHFDVIRRLLRSRLLSFSCSLWSQKSPVCGVLWWGWRLLVYTPLSYIHVTQSRFRADQRASLCRHQHMSPRDEPANHTSQPWTNKYYPFNKVVVDSSVCCICVFESVL